MRLIKTIQLSDNVITMSKVYPQDTILKQLLAQQPAFWLEWGIVCYFTVTDALCAENVVITLL